MCVNTKSWASIAWMGTPILGNPQIEALGNPTQPKKNWHKISPPDILADLFAGFLHGRGGTPMCRACLNQPPRLGE